MERYFTIGDKEYDLVYLRNQESFDFMEDPSKLLDGDIIGFDIETTYREKYKGHKDAGLLPTKTKIRTMQFFDGQTAVVLDLFHVKEGYILSNWKYEKLIGKLVDYLYSVNLIAHNSLFEMSHMYNFMVPHGLLSKPIYMPCTMNMFSLIAQAQTHEWRNLRRSLANVAKLVLGLDVGKETQTSDWNSKVLTQEQIEYAAGDAVITRDIFLALSDKLMELDLSECFKQNTKAQSPISTMKAEGMGVNVEEHANLITRWKEDSLNYKVEIGDQINKNIETRLLEIYEGGVEEVLTTGVVASQKKFVLDSVEYEGENTWGYARIQACIEFLHYAQDQNKYNVDLKANTDHDKQMKRERRAIRRALKNLRGLIVDPGSSKQMSDWLQTVLPPAVVSSWPRTGDTVEDETGVTTITGNGYLKTDAHTLHLHKELDFVAPLLAYKKLNKLVSTYGDKLTDFYVDQDGHHALYPSFSLCYTHTGRMSSFQPNFQNMPNDLEFRNIFIAKGETRKLVICDFSQIEVRVLAYITGEQGLIDVYEQGLDVYSATAARMFNKSIEECGKGTVERKLGKIAVLSLNYGSGPARLKEQAEGPMYDLKLSLDEAKDIVNKFREAYPTLRAWQQSISRQGEEEGTIRTLGGKTRALEPGKTYTTSMNTPIQGCAWEIMRDALIEIDERLITSKFNAHVVNVIHDEVIVDSCQSCTGAVTKIVQKAFENAMLKYFPEATLRGLAEPCIVNKWGEAEK